MIFDEFKFDEKVLIDVRSKKDLMFLSTDFILYHVGEQLRLNKKLREFVHETPLDKLVKSKKYEQIVKYVREKARKPYAIFQIPSMVALRKELLSSVKLTDYAKVVELLNSHLSTKERVVSYEMFFDLVFTKCGKPSSVLDLACGLNPVAFYYYNSEMKNINYVCSELSDLDVQQLNYFFKNNKLSAHAMAFDLVREISELEFASVANKGKQFDICFLLKALDTLEHQKLYVTYDIIKRINAKWIVASFPNQSMRGARMQRSSQIHWFEKMCPRLGLTFERIDCGAEVIYFCKK